jgi:hypothetical protein
MIDETGEKLSENQVVKPKLPSFTFSSANVPIGAEVKFVRDESYVAKVVSDTEVEFEGQILKLSPLTRLIFERLGASNSSGAYAGPQYFSYEEEILSERRRLFSISADD